MINDYDLGIGGGYKYLLSLTNYKGLEDSTNCPKLQYLQGNRIPSDFGRDVPRALSRLMRFGGRSVVNVLEHSILVSGMMNTSDQIDMHRYICTDDYIKDPRFCINNLHNCIDDDYKHIFALFHDFHEVLLGDIAGPFGSHIGTSAHFGGMHLEEWKKTFFDTPLIECFLRSLYFTDAEKGPTREFSCQETNSFMTAITDHISNFDLMKNIRSADVRARNFELELNLETKKPVRNSNFFVDEFYQRIGDALQNLMRKLPEDFALINIEEFRLSRKYRI